MTGARRHLDDRAVAGDGTPQPHKFVLTRVIALMNQKGGVGKTTTTVNLAAGLARRGRRTLLIDLDPQAHSTLHLGTNPDEVKVSAYDLLLEPERAGEAARECRPNLWLVPSVTDLAAAESELASADDRQERLTRAVAVLRSRFEFILFDCPPSLGLLTLNALAAAREVIVPMQAHFLALQGLGKLLETVHLVGKGVNPRLRVSGVVLCMHEETTKHAKEVVADIARFFEESSKQDLPWRGARVYKPPIRRNIKLAECPSFGQTIFEYAPTCPGAADYERLADAFITEWDALLARRSASGGDEPLAVTIPANAPAGAVR
ncbi:MAG: ParA family protein [Phycisphaerae bacterium]|nr:ParA family protein [Phycisphaerae bacterium]